MKTYSAQVWQDQAFGLGESPRWHPTRRTVSWVDIDAGDLWVSGLSGSSTRHHVGAPLGAYALGSSRTALAVGGNWLVVESLQAKRPSLWQQLGEPALRFNDCGIDPYGRLWAATMRRDEVMTGFPCGSLFRLDENSLDPQSDALLAGNGVAWSPDFRVMYLVDSGRNTVFRLEYDVVAGVVGPAVPWVVVDDGIPDGLAVAQDGSLWLAVWGTGEVRRYCPLGKQAGVVTLPASQVTAVCFAGDDLRTLIITTAATGAPSSEVHAGKLFGCTVDVPGMPSPLWNEQFSCAQ